MKVSCGQILGNVLAGSRTRNRLERSTAALLPEGDLVPAAGFKGANLLANNGDLFSHPAECGSGVAAKAILSSPRNSMTHFCLAPSTGSMEAGEGAKAEIVDLDALQTMGAALAPNRREAYRYRIRRKRTIADLVLQLTELYQVGDAVYVYRGVYLIALFCTYCSCWVAQAQVMVPAGRRRR
jgi:hypothetical protein